VMNTTLSCDATVFLLFLTGLATVQVGPIVLAAP